MYTSLLNKTNVFAAEISNFESEIYKSMFNTTNILENNDLTVSVVEGAASIDTRVSIAVLILKTLVENLAESSDWRKSFSHVLKYQIDEYSANEIINSLIASSNTAKEIFPVITKNHDDQASKQRTTDDIHTLLLVMLNKMDIATSILKKFPMFSGPVMETLSLLVVNFETIARFYSPVRAKTVCLSCKIGSILNEYVSLLRQERIFMICKEHMHCPLKAYEIFISVLNLPYNKDGYLKAPRLGFRRSCVTNEMIRADCVSEVISDLRNSEQSERVLGEYASFLRERVEHIFPIEELKSLCSKGECDIQYNSRNLFQFDCMYVCISVKH